MPSLETNRIILRPLTKADFNAVYRIASDEEIVKYMVWGPFDEQGTVRYL